ncbi:MAG: cupin domain-containing protein [bacterium]
MSIQWTVVAIVLISLSTAVSDDSPRIVLIDSATPTKALLAKPGTYLGEKFVFEQEHSGNTLVRIGLWEAGPGKSIIENFPFTEYVLMVSGSVIVTEEDGTSREFVAGDTFVIPKGWSGVWDVQKRMKKQIVRIGRTEQ